MSKHWVKDELKKNFLAEKTDRFLHWLKHNREMAAGIAAGTVVLVLLGTYLNSRSQERREFAWENLFKAEQISYQSPEEGLKMLTEISDKFDGTTAADFASLYKGDTLYQLGKFEDALKAYQTAEQTRNPKITPFAVNGQAVSFAALKKFDESVTAAQRLITSYPDSYLIPQTYLFMAQTQESAGKKDDAVKTYEKLSTHFAETPWAGQAKARLAALQGIPQVPPAAPAPANPTTKNAPK